MRDETAVALSRINSQKAAALLKEAVRSKVCDVREAAAWVLDNIGPNF